MSSIPLHPTKGVNATLCYCPVCGADNNELALVGNHKVYTCRCGVNHIGRPRKAKDCPCKDFREVERRELREGEKVPGGYCQRCTDLLKTANIVICPTCHQMFAGQAHRVVKEFEMGKDALTVEDAMAQGLVVLVVGQVIHTVCGACEAKEKPHG